MRSAVPVLVLAMTLAGTAHADHLGAHPGHQTFLQYCSGCHGVDARGADLSRGAGEHRGDLTRLAGRYGSPLSKTRLLERLGGELPLATAGDPALSLCGRQLEGLEPGAGAAAARRGTALAILYFLDAIQARD